MFRAAGPLALAAAEEPEHAVRVPITVGNPAAHEPDLAGKGRAGKTILVAAKKTVDGVMEFRRNLLVGVERKNPRLGGMTEGEVFLFAKALPRMPKNFRAEGKGDVLRAILHAFVQHDHDLGSPAGHAGQKTSDPLRFRAGNNADRNGQLVHRRFFLGLVGLMRVKGWL